MQIMVAMLYFWNTTEVGLEVKGVKEPTYKYEVWSSCKKGMKMTYTYLYLHL